MKINALRQSRHNSFPQSFLFPYIYYIYLYTSIPPYPHSGGQKNFKEGAEKGRESSPEPDVHSTARPRPLSSFRHTGQAAGESVGQNAGTWLGSSPAMH